jgi:hypothetical protein
MDCEDSAVDGGLRLSRRCNLGRDLQGSERLAHDYVDRGVHPVVLHDRDPRKPLSRKDGAHKSGRSVAYLADTNNRLAQWVVVDRGDLEPLPLQRACHGGSQPRAGGRVVDVDSHPARREWLIRGSPVTACVGHDVGGRGANPPLDVRCGKHNGPEQQQGDASHGGHSAVSPTSPIDRLSRFV